MGKESRAVQPADRHSKIADAPTQTAAVNGKINRFGRGSVFSLSPQKAPSRSPNRCVTDGRTDADEDLSCLLRTDGRTGGSCGRHEFRGHVLAAAEEEEGEEGRAEGNRLSSAGGGPAAVPSREPLAALVPAAFSFRGTDHRDHVGKAGSIRILNRAQAKYLSKAKC